MNSLTDLYISDSYTGLLHSGGQPLPAGGKNPIYDGSGQASGLSLGLSATGVGASALTVGTLTYPNSNATTGSFLIHTSANTIGRVANITSSHMADLNPSPAGTYSIITQLTVNSKGQVTNVETSDADNDYVTVTRTRYRKLRAPLGTVVFDEVNPNDWHTIVVNDVSDDAKSVVCFAELIGNFATASEREITVFASSSQSDTNAYPIIHLRNEQGRGLGNGAQFVVPISTNKRFYVSSNSEHQPWTLRLWLLGYQE